MKPILSLISSVSFMFLATLPAKADMLNNGNFNTGDYSSWWSYVPDTANSSLTVTNDPGISLDGTPYLYIMGRNPSSAPVLGQDSAAPAGTQYQVSLEFRGNNWGAAGLAVNYLDASYTYINYEWAQLYTGNGTDTGWQSFSSPIWIAPANTAYLEIRLDGWGWSDTYIDNVSLNLIPEPGCAALFGLGGLALLISRRCA